MESQLRRSREGPYVLGKCRVKGLMISNVHCFAAARCFLFCSYPDRFLSQCVSVWIGFCDRVCFLFFVRRQIPIPVYIIHGLETQRANPVGVLMSRLVLLLICGM